MVWTTAADSIDQDNAPKEKKELLNVQKPGDDAEEKFDPGQEYLHLELGEEKVHMTFSGKKDGFETSGDVSTTSHKLQRLVVSVPGSLLRCCKLGFPTFSGVHGAEGHEVNPKLLRHGQKQDDQSVEPRPETGQVYFQQGFGGAHLHGGPFQLEDDVSCISGMFRSLRVVFAGWLGRPLAVTENKPLLAEPDDVPYGHVRVLREKDHVHTSKTFSITGDGGAATIDSADACVYSPEYMTMESRSVAKAIEAGDVERDQGHVRVLNKKGHVGTGDVSTNEDGVPPVSADSRDTFVLPPDHLSKDGHGEVGDVDVVGGNNIDEEYGHQEEDDGEDENEEDKDDEDEDEDDEDEAVEETVNLGSEGNPIVVGNLSSSDFEAIVFDVCPLLP